MRRDPVADQLGLTVQGEPQTLALQDGVILTFRVPEAVDFSIAGGMVARMMAGANAAAEGRRRYGLDGSADTVALADPAVWEGVAEFCVNVELAARIVTEVSRQVGDERRSVEPSVEAFRLLFRIGDNLDRFVAKAKQANRELISAKKE